MEAPGVEIIFNHFPLLSRQQKSQFEALAEIYFDWNQQINVISREDIQSIYLKHVLHSLGIAQVQDIPSGTSVLDVGTGGGFPGIPLAILFPEVSFQLVDSVAKKIKVVKAVSEALQLTNVSSAVVRAEQVAGRFDFIVSRAVTRLSNFIPWVGTKLKNGGSMIFLKGGDLQEEIRETGFKITQHDLQSYFPSPFFEGKKVLILPRHEIKKKFFSRRKSC